jgi:hypothetical protein
MQIAFEMNIDSVEDLVKLAKELPSTCVTTQIPAAMVRELLAAAGYTETYLKAEVSEHGRTIRFEGEYAYFDRTEPEAVRTEKPIWVCGT